jgi:hypothetical protein
MQLAEILKELNIEDEAQFLLASASYVNFAETYFKDPDDMSKPLRLEKGQKQVINALQFGYDIDSVPTHYINRNPPKGVVMIWPRQTGKTTGVVTFCCSAMCLEPGIRIGVMAQSEPTAKEIIRRIRRMLRASPFNDQVEKYQTMEIHMKNMSMVMAHTTSENIRGFSYHYVILDEAARIEDKIIEGAALHTARKIGRRWAMLSTPEGYKGLLVKYYKQGLKTRRIICRNCLTEFTQGHFENVKFDALFIPAGMPACMSCGHYEEDVTDEDGRSYGNTYFYGAGDYTVVTVDPFKTSFYPKEEIIAELERGGWSATLRQELLGEIIAEGEAIFTEEQLDRAENLSRKNVIKPDTNVHYIAGVDFGKTHDNSVITIVHLDRESGKIILDYQKVILARYHGKEYDDIKNDLLEIILAFRPTTIIPDATGVGEPIIEQMEKDLARAGWWGTIFSNKKNHLGFWFDIRSKPDLIDNLQNLFQRGRIEMPHRDEPSIDMLRNELLSFSYEMTNTNYIKYGVQLEHDDTVIAFALAVWGLREKPWLPLQAVYATKRGSL